MKRFIRRPQNRRLEASKSLRQRSYCPVDIKDLRPTAKNIKSAAPGRKPSPPSSLVSHGFETAASQLPGSRILQAYTGQRFDIVSHGCFFDGKILAKPNRKTSLKRVITPPL